MPAGRANRERTERHNRHSCGGGGINDSADAVSLRLVDVCAALDTSDEQDSVVVEYPEGFAGHDVGRSHSNTTGSNTADYQ